MFPNKISKKERIQRAQPDSIDIDSKKKTVGFRSTVLRERKIDKEEYKSNNVGKDGILKQQIYPRTKDQIRRTMNSPKNKYLTMLQRLSLLENNVENLKSNFLRNSNSKNSNKYEEKQKVTIDKTDKKDQVETDKDLEKIIEKEQIQITSKQQQEQPIKTIKEQFKSDNSTLKNAVTQVSAPKFHFHSNINPYTSNQSNNQYYIAQILKYYKTSKSIPREHIKASIIYLSKLTNTKIPKKIQLQKRLIQIPISQLQNNKITIVFDLDQTLIHCTENGNNKAQVILDVKFPTGQIIQAGINIRPYAKQLLKNLAEHFQLVIFTASQPFYANVVIDYLDPGKKFIKYRLFRQSCYLASSGDAYIKDLRIINRKLSKMLLVDNAAYSYAYQLENGVPILPYYDGKQDFELKALQNYLLRFKDCADVRILNRDTFKLIHYLEYKPQQFQDLVDDLYK